MENRTFDNLSRTIAARTSRRDALRRAGRTGLIAGALSAVGIRSSDALAQGDYPRVCEMTIKGTYSAGPSAGVEFVADLMIEIEKDGSIDVGELTLADGSVYDVVGDAHGRAISLRVDWDDDTSIAMTGTAQRRVDRCKGEMSGSMGGPLDGDTGTWRVIGEDEAVPTPEPEGESTEEATEEPTEEIPTESPTESPTEEAGTETPTACEEIDCTYGGSTGALYWDPAVCDCVCYTQPSTRCGNICGFAGCVCDEVAGSCVCAPGMEGCGNSCLPVCASGTTRNWDTCECA